ncbi:OLC1v1019217C2 [Oldenlandia corymbosa var. corymbosa]|uniref:OLC1v1019217C2 n=1 Tax=Oldenlandia corymbosa var. corymbosa TaxID=529605 RepID=A0AAV1EDK0_OLDCO|nr:OLC1v1019217C2 [Oldenlandia corymbosa var. corymbosa]
MASVNEVQGNEEMLLDWGVTMAMYAGEILNNLKWMIQWHKNVEKETSGEPRDSARQFLELTIDNDLVPGPIIEKVNQLKQDWAVLDMLVRSILYSSDAAELLVMQNQVLLATSINALVVGGMIDAALCSCAKQYASYMTRPDEMLSLLSDCQRKTDELYQAEARDIAKELSRLPINSRSPDSFFWQWFVPVVGENLQSFKVLDDGVLNEKLFFLGSEMQSIQRYLNHIQRGLSSANVHGDPRVDSFLNHVASVVLRIAVQSCYFWFNMKDPEAALVIVTGLLGEHHQIDPRNPEFLELNLRFLESLYRINSKRNDAFASASVRLFCVYLLNWLDEKDLRKELVSLLSLFFSNTLKDGVDVHNFFSEIKAVVAEAAFYHRVAPRDLSPCSVLLTKICLLKAELNLKESMVFLNSQSPLILFKDDRIFSLSMILVDLRAFNKDLCQPGNSEYVKQSLKLTEELANAIESLHKLLQSKRIIYPLVKQSILHLLCRIIFFKAESFLTELLKSSETSLALQKGQIQSLLEELTYFNIVVKAKLERSTSDGEAIILQIEDVVRGITLLSYLYLPDEKFQKIAHSLPQLLEKVNTVKAKLREMNQPFPKSIFPMTYGLGFLDFLHRNIGEVLKHDTKSITPVMHHFEEVMLHLESLKCFLAKVKDSDVQLGELKDLGDHIIDVAYKLENVVESIEIDGPLQHLLWFYDALDDIRLIERQIHKVQEMSYSGEVEYIIPQVSLPIVPKFAAPEINEMLVDLVDEDMVIVDRLTRGSSQRDVVSIVGMPGIGKTTLARKVFSNPNVTCHFRRRAWCTVSQTYSKRELLLELLSHILVRTDGINQLTDDDLLSKLRRYLLGNKYLIVMDDLWDTAAWNDLKICFPDDSNGSRILITSRHQDVAVKIKPDSDPHPMRPFSDIESWKLLENKIFMGADCPAELLEVGMEIARHCQGLPLAVVAIAGLLQKLEKEKNRWKKISESLSSEIISNPENRCHEILELSYKHLPENLKACFIYLGIFLEDKEIPVSKLIRIWVAEGFVLETESKSLEEVAEDYLMELINRSLVSIYRTRSNGKVKTCRLHDLLRDLCQLKAKEEKFLQLVTRHDEPYVSLPDSEYGLEFDETLLGPIVFESYRLSFYVNRRHFNDSQPSGPGARSLIFFATSYDSEPKFPYDISFICQNFKLLRVLDLESIMASSFPVEIGLMIQLRCLAVSGYMQSIPPSISNLWKLETLVVKGLRKVTLPETIWSMVRLRHLHVNNHVAFNLKDLDEDGDFPLVNMVSFSTPSLSCREDRWRILKRFPNLRKLRCIFWLSGDSSGKSSEFIRWNFLTCLESLKIICYRGAPTSGDFLLPLNLKKLSLSNFCLQENHLSVIGALPNLGVLKLRAGAFQGQKWDMREEEFKELKFLELDTMNLVEWDASYDHFPCLEQLVLRNCEDLQRIPFEFAYIATLQKVEVHWCGQSVEVSAKEISDETQEIKVIISC